jgi:hypothetical protein
MGHPKRVDQYGDPVPDDLVTLPDYENLGPKEIKAVEDARWYEADGCLMASAKELKGLSEDDPIDSGVDLDDENIEIFLIEGFLKRHGTEGFYHA